MAQDQCMLFHQTNAKFSDSLLARYASVASVSHAHALCRHVTGCLHHDRAGAVPCGQAGTVTCAMTVLVLAMPMFANHACILSYVRGVPQLPGARTRDATVASQGGESRCSPSDRHTACGCGAGR